MGAHPSSSDYQTTSILLLLLLLLLLFYSTTTAIQSINSSGKGTQNTDIERRVDSQTFVCLLFFSVAHFSALNFVFVR
jgi:hypothetical protein